MSRDPDPKRAVVASRLREARKLAGLSQGQVAKLLSMHRPTVTEIEAGNRSVNAEELATFAKAYDVSVSWIVGESPDQLGPEDPRLQLAARELSKLKPDDLERLLRLLAAMRDKDTKD